MAGIVAALVSQLNGGESSVRSQLFGSDLVDRDCVVETLPGFRVAVRASEPESAAPMGLVVVLVCQVLDDGEVLAVFCQGSESLGKRVVTSRIRLLGIPALLGHPEAHPQKDEPFGWSRSAGGLGERSKSEGIKKRQRDQSRAASKKSAALEGVELGVHFL